MTCTHEPEDRIHAEPTTCRRCHAAIERGPCAECNGTGTYIDERGNGWECDGCDGTGEGAWREVR